MTVSPGCASASTSAAMRVPATATCTRDAARRRLAPQLLADGARRTEQPLEAADVDRHQIVAVPLVARRELLRERDERACAASEDDAAGSRAVVEARVQAERMEIRRTRDEGW